ncbi:MAG: hypothetical protein Q7W56_12225 [Candidatus Latescibacteria bacterium]|nr:hypothetical protein [Candidatus Latescibacterota bacterium]
MGVWDDLRRNMGAWYDTAAEKTGEMARVGSRRYDIFGIGRDIERHYSEIGKLVHEGLLQGRTEFGADPAVLDLVERIQKLEADLEVKRREIEEIRDGERRRRGLADPGLTRSRGVPRDDDEEDDPRPY